LALGHGELLVTVVVLRKGVPEGHGGYGLEPRGVLDRIECDAESAGEVPQGLLGPHPHEEEGLHLLGWEAVGFVLVIEDPAEIVEGGDGPLGEAGKPLSGGSRQAEREVTAEEMVVLGQDHLLVVLVDVVRWVLSPIVPGEAGALKALRERLGEDLGGEG
jgi:hypothetical protein